MQAGRKYKYSEQTVSVLELALSKSGSDKLAWESAGITSTTFYKWMKEKPEFRERMEAAKKSFHNNLMEDNLEKIDQYIQLVEDINLATLRGELYRRKEFYRVVGDKEVLTNVEKTQIEPQQWLLERYTPISNTSDEVTFTVKIEGADG